MGYTSGIQMPGSGIKKNLFQISDPGSRDKKELDHGSRIWIHNTGSNICRVFSGIRSSLQCRCQRSRQSVSDDCQEVPVSKSHWPVLFASDSMPALMAALVASVMVTVCTFCPFKKSSAVSGGPKTENKILYIMCWLYSNSVCTVTV